MKIKCNFFDSKTQIFNEASLDDRGNIKVNRFLLQYIQTSVFTSYLTNNQFTKVTEKFSSDELVSIMFERPDYFDNMILAFAEQNSAKNTLAFITPNLISKAVRSKFFSTLKNVINDELEVYYATLGNLQDFEREVKVDCMASNLQNKFCVLYNKSEVYIEELDSINAHFEGLNLLSEEEKQNYIFGDKPTLEIPKEEAKKDEESEGGYDSFASD